MLIDPTCIFLDPLDEIFNVAKHDPNCGYMLLGCLKQFLVIREVDLRKNINW